ncbi:60S ribosomal protein-like protein [Hapsidospora chrysogenum ATCC 11550]|uniref:60S ribosomal protein-like protein n=1 Tax=Hapsidospora chrysogenum (strain ATCC 11550 / CBS 779.69 / DSM 880 / IAM 14645 / JCM 23072 / IMI 49137) TaxID=857340 RepID=A0A086T1A3_HAPC1|nr:60S ribosomal protein-like protein [Hapsidospora chrysogenum ATCC 11550]
MASPALPNISGDLIWEVVRDNNCFLAKTRQDGGVQFSRDPLNLINKNTRKHAGFVNDKAIGIVRKDKGFTVITKKPSAPTKPKEAFLKSEHSGAKSSRRAYKSVANQTAKNGYRADLREAAVQRVSAIRQSQRPVKPEPEPKLRGNKAKKAAESS